MGMLEAPLVRGSGMASSLTIPEAQTSQGDRYSTDENE